MSIARARSPAFGSSTFHRSPTAWRVSTSSDRFVITTIVLIRVEPPMIPKAAHMLAGVDGVTEDYSQSGQWDLLAIERVPDNDDIAQVTSEIIPTVPRI